MSKRSKLCCECGKKLAKDEVALCKKLLSIETEDFYCMECFSEFLECSREDLEIKILEFKEQGCTLFL